MKKIVILYHAQCGDGFGAAWAAYKRFGARATYIPVKHQEPLPAGLKGAFVYIIDFSYPKDTMVKLLKSAKRVIVLDHHISAKEQAEMADEHVYSIDHSGAILAWQYFHPTKPIPKLLTHIEDIDLWRFRLPKTREIIAYINSFEWSFRFFDALARKLDNITSRRDIIKEGAAIVRYQEGMVERAVKNAYRVSFGGKKVLALNSSVLSSEIGNVLATTHSPFAIVWSRKDEKIVVSLRSDGTYDVSKLAQRYGGGGHKAAAGFTISIDAPFPWKTLKK